ncbi:hypothetical protein O6H91_07G042100 [Diphasiastrum complanatum]|uniref:Uncharacterized protein n=2 Tax=Diphasiastrum complanatum TaxID=34168 RepID=A0ACC2D4I0_DIPCM|nr:hypothetical protein O6H91_07G042100 [Diphasiastrum complanatum]
MMLRTPPSKRPRWVPATQNEQEPDVDAAADDRLNLLPNSEVEVEVALPGETASELVPYNGGRFSEPLLQNPHHRAYLAGGAEEEDVEWDSLRCSYKCRSMVKSEVLETLNLRERQLVECEAVLQSLKEDINNKEVENNRLIEKVNELEQEVAAKSGQEDALRRQRATEFEKAEVRFRKQLARCNELQASLQEEIKKKAEAEHKASTVEAQLIAVKAGGEKAANNAARELHQLKEEIQKIYVEKEIAVSRLKSEIEFEKRRVQGARAEAEAFQFQCKELENYVAKILDEKRDLDHQLSDAVAKASSKSLTDASEAEVLVRHLRKELENCAADVAEAKRMKQFHANVELLREQLESETQRANRTEAALADHVDLQLRVKSLETELEAWKEILNELPDVQCRADVPRKMAELQREAVAALAKVGESTVKLVEMQTTAQKGETIKQHDSSDIVAARAEVDELKDKVMRLERQVSRLIKERDGLKSILASYDEEEAVLVRQTSSTNGVAPISTPEKAKQLRIQQLEVSLADAQKTIKQMENDLEKRGQLVKEHRHKADLLVVDLKKAEDKIKRVEQDGDQLRKEISVLEHKLGCGHFNPAKTKVLRLREKLETSNQESSDSTQGIAPEVELPRPHDAENVVDSCNNYTEEDAQLASKIASLEQEITVLRKRETRYKQVFADKIFTFRNACALIFGYELVMNEEADSTVTLFALTSIYSKDRDMEKIEFRYVADRIEMLANAYTSRTEIARQVTTFVQGFKSIPAFTANLTLELFNRTTIG